MYMLYFASRKTVVLSDRRLVKELMDKRSSVTSNRPPAVILENMLYDGDEMLLMQANNPRWRMARKFLHQNFMGSMVEKTHMPLINAEATQMLRELLVQPEAFIKHSKRFGNSFMMSVGKFEATRYLNHERD
jgi:cytochrome P450